MKNNNNVCMCVFIESPNREPCKVAHLHEDWLLSPGRQVVKKGNRIVAKCSRSNPEVYMKLAKVKKLVPQ